MARDAKAEFEKNFKAWRAHLRERATKDALFIGTQLLFGVLVVLGASV